MVRSSYVVSFPTCTIVSLCIIMWVFIQWTLGFFLTGRKVSWLEPMEPIASPFCSLIKNLGAMDFMSLFLGIWKNIVKEIERATAGGPCSSGNIYIYVYMLLSHQPAITRATRPWIPSSAQVAIEQLASPQTFAPYMGPQHRFRVSGFVIFYEGFIQLVGKTGSLNLHAGPLLRRKPSHLCF